MTIYITGDTHREFSRLENFKFKKDDMLIILGDVGINYFHDIHDMIEKEKLKKYNIKFFCIRGNHEDRPENIDTYKEVEMFGGKVYIEDDYPHLIFAKDGETYNFNNKQVLVIGGAYSVDKYYRIATGNNWFPDEQLSLEEMDYIFDKVKDKHYDLVLTHTCPRKYEPIEVFLPGLDQSKIDKSMEDFLDKVEENITYDKWYCGHYHTEKKIDNLEFMFKNIKKLFDNENSIDKPKEYTK